MTRAKKRSKRFYYSYLDLNRQSKTQIRPRVEEYVERIVSNYTAEEFKTDFRYSQNNYCYNSIMFS